MTASPTPKSPREAIIAVNYRCNARCSMCDIWKLKEDGTLTAQDYRRLPAGLDSVSITGGEPFMRKDIVDIVRTVHEVCQSPQIIINTNGYLADRIVAAFRELRSLKPSLGAGISLDGIGAMHDKVRGTPNAFGKVLRTIRALQADGVTNIRISYTATPDNVGDLVDVYELARSLDVEFSSVLAHNSEHYFHTETNEVVDGPLLRQAYSIVNGRELSSASVKRWFRAYYNSGVVLFNEEGRRLVPCTAASDFFFLSPRGDVYPCLVLTKKLGNLLEHPFDELWAGAHVEEIRREVEGCERCWMMCSARTMLKKRALSAAAWVAREQLGRYASAFRRASAPVDE